MLNLRQIASHPHAPLIRVPSKHCLASDLSTVSRPSRAPSINFCRTALLKGISKYTWPNFRAEDRLVRDHRARQNALFDSL
jgi:hypothetical protein